MHIFKNNIIFKYQLSIKSETPQAKELGISRQFSQSTMESHSPQGTVSLELLIIGEDR